MCSRNSASGARGPSAAYPAAMPILAAEWNSGSGRWMRRWAKPFFVASNTRDRIDLSRAVFTSPCQYSRTRGKGSPIQQQQKGGQPVHRRECQGQRHVCVRRIEQEAAKKGRGCA